LWTDLIHPGLRPSKKRGEAQPSPGTVRRKGREVIRKPARRLDTVEGLAQEDGGQGALLGRNEQGLWTDLSPSGAASRVNHAARLNRVQEP